MRDAAIKALHDWRMAWSAATFAPVRKKIRDIQQECQQAGCSIVPSAESRRRGALEGGRVYRLLCRRLRSDAEDRHTEHDRN